MAIDISKMKAKLEALQNGGKAKSKTNFFTPKEGNTYLVRIVDTGDGDPLKEAWFHYGIGKGGFLCPNKNYKEDCAVCNFAKKLYKENTEASIAMAKDFNARQRFFSPVVVRGEEKEGVKVWGYGKNVYQRLIELALDPDYGDFVDAHKGHDLTVKATKAAGQQYPMTSVMPKPKPSRLAETDGDIDTLLNGVPQFDTIHDRKTSAEVAAILDEHLAAPTDKEVEAESSQTTKYGGAAPATKKKSTDAIDEAFASILG